jgi:hypothetical protein
LHATGPAPPETTLQPFEAKQLAQSLPAAELPGYLDALKEDPPCDLSRNKPDSALWYEVLTCQRSIANLSDDEVFRLQYVATGA